MPKKLKLLIHPAIEAERLAALRAAAPKLEIVNADDVAQARAAIEDADAFFGKLTPDLLSAARHLRWVQSPTASLEHYVFPELIAHPCVLTNMRGLFSDVSALTNSPSDRAARAPAAAAAPTASSERS